MNIEENIFTWGKWYWKLNNVPKVIVLFECQNSAMVKCYIFLNGVMVIWWNEWCMLKIFDYIYFTCTLNI